MRDIHLPGRSTVYGTRGAAATAHPLATLAAIDILRRGGNAIDAAIGACAVQCVTEPNGTGIGGDCFAMCWLDAERRVVAINGSGHTPAALTADWLTAQGLKTIAGDSVHSVTIPGAVDAWCRLNADHGRLPMAEVLEPAIHYAGEGFAVSPCIAVEWAAATEKLARSPHTARQFLHDGKAPAAGAIRRHPELAATLRAIARNGRDGFYRGDVATDMVTSLRNLGGAHTLEDFAVEHSTYVAPITATYRGIELVQMPPNAQGVVTLLIMKILEGFDLAQFPPQSAERFHLLMEATRLAFEIKESIGDPAFSDTLVEKFLTDSFVEAMRKRITLDRAAAGPALAAAGGRDTIYVAVADADRNVCSFINSLYLQFGSGLASEKSGVLFHNRGFGFTLAPGKANSVAPRKRPSHTILPGLAMKQGRPWLALGVKGAAYQPIGQAQILTNLIDYGLDPQEAIDDARCAYNDGRIDVERGVSDAVRRGLTALGHRVAETALPHGGAQCVTVDWDRGTLAAASDPRKDGLALCY
jgi:gamma-glutamyltranspeptidase / glutathione hydrolase